jgi:hypothetical protein
MPSRASAIGGRDEGVVSGEPLSRQSRVAVSKQEPSGAYCPEIYPSIPSLRADRRMKSREIDMANQYRVLGFDDAITTCDCCGKANLKGTFAVERADGEILHYGSVCVTRHTNKPAKIVRHEAKLATEARREAARLEVRAHPTFDVYEARMSEARIAGLRPVEFVAFCRAEREAQEAAQREIAARHGLKFFEVYA